MEAARTSSGSGTRHRRCRCCLPALTGFTTSRRGEADASHHGRARDGSARRKDWQKNRPPAARGRDPTTLGREGILRGGDRLHPRRKGGDPVRPGGRASARGSGEWIAPARPLGRASMESARRACFRDQHHAARRRKETPTRCWRAAIERNSRQAAATVGGRRRYLAPKQVFLIQIAGRWVQPGYSRADRGGTGPDKPVIVVAGGGSWTI